MSRVLIVIDMQNDFVTGALGSKEAQAIVPNVQAKIKKYADRGDRIIFTRDTHEENYLDTAEGKKLPACGAVGRAAAEVQQKAHPGALIRMAKKMKLLSASATSTVITV